MINRRWHGSYSACFTQQCYVNIASDWLKLKPPPARDLMKTVRDNLRGVHSAWTNWCLKKGRTRKHASNSQGVQYDFKSTPASLNEHQIGVIL